jgi:endonuclease III
MAPGPDSLAEGGETTTSRARTRAPARRASSRARGRTGSRRAPDAAKAWARRLARARPGLIDYTLDALASAYGQRSWQRVHDPTSELVLTILSQNSADVNAERAFDDLRARYPGADAAPEGPGAPATAEPRVNRPGWGGGGIERAPAPGWAAVETAPLEDLIDAIKAGGLHRQKAPRIQAALQRIREARGDYSLEFLGRLPALEARDWLTSIDGVGRKTASVVLLFSFGMPLMPVDRHVERVSKRIGLLPPKATADEAHAHYLAMLRPDEVYPAHVGLISHGRRICHAARPACMACPIRPRCRHVDRRAP